MTLVGEGQFKVRLCIYTGGTKFSVPKDHVVMLVNHVHSSTFLCPKRLGFNESDVALRNLQFSRDGGPDPFYKLQLFESEGNSSGSVEMEANVNFLFFSLTKIGAIFR